MEMQYCCLYLLTTQPALNDQPPPRLEIQSGSRRIPEPEQCLKVTSASFSTELNQLLLSRPIFLFPSVFIGWLCEVWRIMFSSPSSLCSMTKCPLRVSTRRANVDLRTSRDKRGGIAGDPDILNSACVIKPIKPTLADKVETWEHLG
ncbi:hypothetical protein RRG08_001085 [Elysia crispata]|uniref:Uncharacterized protein n=1 Tax=Elysia crispata TaxID=231223 RepID=A0AAE1E6S6_9GAST|nr:hypothetical protein RRG08_001085 [Elysia crispata]